MSDARRNAIQHELAALRDAARAASRPLDSGELRQQAVLHAERDALDAAAAVALRERDPVEDPSQIAWRAEMDEQRRQQRKAARITAGVFIGGGLLMSYLAISVLGPAGIVVAALGIAFGGLRYAQARSRRAAADSRTRSGLRDDSGVHRPGGFW